MIETAEVVVAVALDVREPETGGSAEVLLEREHRQVSEVFAGLKTLSTASGAGARSGERAEHAFAVLHGNAAPAEHGGAGEVLGQRVGFVENQGGEARGARDAAIGFRFEAASPRQRLLHETHARQQPRAVGLRCHGFKQVGERVEVAELFVAIESQRGIEIALGEEARQVEQPRAIGIEARADLDLEPLQSIRRDVFL